MCWNFFPDFSLSVCFFSTVVVVAPRDGLERILFTRAKQKVFFPSPIIRFFALCRSPKWAQNCSATSEAIGTLFVVSLVLSSSDYIFFLFFLQLLEVELCECIVPVLVSQNCSKRVNHDRTTKPGRENVAHALAHWNEAETEKDLLVFRLVLRRSVIKVIFKVPGRKKESFKRIFFFEDFKREKNSKRKRKLFLKR